MKKAISSLIGAIVVAASVGTVAAVIPKTTPTCDGTKVTEQCLGEDGTLYETFKFHPAEPAKTHTVNHPAEPAKTHTVNHPAEYGTRTYTDCIRTSISYKNGTCALSQCRDGSYSGSTGRGTCSYHGGVARSGGPWYTTRTEQYLIKAAWSETVVDVPYKASWSETIIDEPAKEEYWEKVPALVENNI